jgi:ketosteroid isomerase-like protein
MNNIDTVKQLYACFGRGDVAGILAHLAEDVRWDDTPYQTAVKAGVTALTPRFRRADVAEFFKIIGAWKFNAFEVKAIAQSGNAVFSQIALDVTLPNGAAYRDEEIHFFEFDDQGQVKRFRHFLDTAAMAELTRSGQTAKAA